MEGQRGRERIEDEFEGQRSRGDVRWRIGGVVCIFTLRPQCLVHSIGGAKHAVYPVDTLRKIVSIYQ